MTNLSLCTHRTSSSHSGEYFSMYLTLILLGLAISEYPDIVLYILLNINLNCDTLFPCSFKFSKSISRTIFIIISLFMFSVALSQLGCLFVLQICCHSLNKKEPHWLPILLILLSNDIQLNPGPTLQNNLFKLYDMEC